MKTLYTKVWPLIQEHTAFWSLGGQGNEGWVWIGRSGQGTSKSSLENTYRYVLWEAWGINFDSQ